MTAVHEPTLADAMADARQVIAELDLTVDGTLVGDPFWREYMAAVRNHREQVLEDLAAYRHPRVVSMAATMRLTVLALAELAICDRVLGPRAAASIERAGA